MTYEEINNALLKASDNEAFNAALSNATEPEEIGDILKAYHVAGTEEDVENFMKLMNTIEPDELNEQSLESVSGGGISDLFNVPKWINDAAKEIWKGIKGSFKAGKAYEKWLQKHGWA